MKKLLRKILKHQHDVFRSLPAPMLIAVDFDGTCVTENYPEIGRDMPGCVNTLKALVARGHKLILWTCREGKELNDAIEWFKERDIQLWGINETAPEDDFRENGGRKVFANLYIDDKAFGGFPGWDKIHLELIGLPLIL